MLGPVSSSAAEYTQQTVGLPYSMPIVTGAGDAVALTNEGEYPYYLSVYPSNKFEARGINSLLQMHNVQNVAVFYRPSEDSSSSLVSQLSAMAQSSGWQILREYSVDYGQDDFTKDLNDLATLQVESVLLFPWDTDITATIFGQAYEMGLAGGESKIQWIVDDYSLTSSGFQVHKFLGWEGA